MSDTDQPYVFPWEQASQDAAAAINSVADDEEAFSSNADAVNKRAAEFNSEKSDPSDHADDLASAADKVQEREPDPNALDSDDDGPSEEDDGAEDEPDDDESEEEEPEQPKRGKKPSEVLAELRKQGIDPDDVLVENRAGAQVTLSEAIEDGLRMADWTKRTQAVAQERQQTEQFVRSVGEIERAHDEAIAQVVEVTQAVMSALPPELLQQVAPAIQEMQARRHALSRQSYEVQQHYSHAESQRLEFEHRQRLESQREQLLEAVPEWRDENAYAEGVSKVREYAVSIGATNEDLRAIGSSAAAIQLVEKARRYDEMQRRTKSMPKPRVVQSDKPVLRPGTTERDSGRKARRLSRQKAMDRLSETGSVYDSAEVFKLLGTVD